MAQAESPPPQDALDSFESPDDDLAAFEKTGYIRWASDLAGIPKKHGVNNVYGEVGTALANSAVTNPRFAAALMGTLIKGMGIDQVVGNGFGLVRLAALADRGLRPGSANGAVKSRIFGHNSARLYYLDLHAELPARIKLAVARAASLHAPTRDNLACGYVARRAPETPTQPLSHEGSSPQMARRLRKTVLLVSAPCPPVCVVQLSD